MIRQFMACALVLAASPACAQPAAEADKDSGLVARFGDEAITRAELDQADEVKAQMVAIRQQEYDIKRQHLEHMIFDRLVDRAAAAEGISRQEYLKKYVVDKIDPPSEEDIAKIMSAYRARLDPDQEKARQQVVNMLRQQSGNQLQDQLQKRLFSEYDVQILLEPMRFEAVVTDQLPSRGGGPDAPVTLIEYSDFQCPYCHRIQPTVTEILERYDGNIRHVFKQLPLPMHQQAEMAAEASLCAQDQGKFWDFHKWLFANSRRLSQETIVTRAEDLKMDVPAFSSCLESNQHADEVRADMAEANSFGINGTPGFLVNGRLINGARPLDDFIKVIDEELRMAGIEPPAAPEANPGAASP